MRLAVTHLFLEADALVHLARVAVDEEAFTARELRRHLVTDQLQHGVLLTRRRTTQQQLRM